MEVSSHALELHRADAIHWAVAVFTNLTQDHLDFHPTMEDYFAAKRRLFEAGPRGGGRQRRRRVRRAGSPRDVPRRASRSAIDRRTPTCARPTSQSDASGSSFTVGGLRAALAAARAASTSSTCSARVAAARALGVDDATIAARAAAAPRRVPGRFEPVDEGQGFAVLVDYAHTPDSLENVLRAARAARRDGGA